LVRLPKEVCVGEVNQGACTEGVPTFQKWHFQAGGGDPKKKRILERKKTGIQGKSL